jgi:hypothetical protein
VISIAAGFAKPLVSVFGLDVFFAGIQEVLASVV